jgi:hypothetical protein
MDSVPPEDSAAREARAKALGEEVLNRIRSARIVLEDAAGNELLWAEIGSCGRGDTITYTIPSEVKIHEQPRADYQLPDTESQRPERG